jgi:hypothetical protein
VKTFNENDNRRKMNARKQDRKLLGTLHTARTVDEYYHVRTIDGSKTTFELVLVRNTPQGHKEYHIGQEDLPKSIKTL